MAASATTPLLPVSAFATPSRDASSMRLSRLQKVALTCFSTIRFLRGVSLIAYPRLGLLALDVSPSGEAYMLASLIGVRDVILAGLLFTAPYDARYETSRALAASLLSDAMDAFVLIFYTAWSSHWGNPIVPIVIAGVLAILEHLMLWSMSDPDDDAAGDWLQRIGVEDLKATRVSEWLRELRRSEPSRPATPSTAVLRREPEGEV